MQRDMKKRIFTLEKNDWVTYREILLSLQLVLKFPHLTFIPSVLPEEMSFRLIHFSFKLKSIMQTSPTIIIKNLQRQTQDNNIIKIQDDLIWHPTTITPIWASQCISIIIATKVIRVYVPLALKNAPYTIGPGTCITKVNRVDLNPCWL